MDELMVIRRGEGLESANRRITRARMYNIVCTWASKRFAPKPRRLLATLLPLNPTRLGQKRPRPNNRRGRAYPIGITDAHPHVGAETYDRCGVARRQRPGGGVRSNLTGLSTTRL